MYSNIRFTRSHSILKPFLIKGKQGLNFYKYRKNWVISEKYHKIVSKVLMGSQQKRMTLIIRRRSVVKLHNNTGSVFEARRKRWRKELWIEMIMFTNKILDFYQTNVRISIFSWTLNRNYSSFQKYDIFLRIF